MKYSTQAQHSIMYSSSPKEHFSDRLLASAAISALMLLGSVGMLGPGTMLIGELPRQRQRAGALIGASLWVSSAVSVGLGVAFVLLAPVMTAEFGPLSQSTGRAALFALGVGLTAFALVLDQALIGLLRGWLQWGRNAIFAATKLAALLAAGLWLARSGLTIYATWVAGNLFSLVALAGILAHQGVRVSPFRPQWGLLRGLGRAALAHHALNLLLQAPGQILPIVATALFTAKANASYYVAWMVASLVFIVPSAFSTVLYALGAADPSALAHKMRLTIGLSLAVGAAASGVLLAGAERVLGLFGASYALQAGWCLRFLSLGIFPLTIRAHYIAICRVRGQLAVATKLMAIGCLLELLLAGVGGQIGGLAGLGLGWLIAACVEALFMARTVYAAVALPAREVQARLGAQGSSVSLSGLPESAAGPEPAEGEAEG